MAQIDTGLGWSAKDSWLISGSGDIAAIPGGYNWTITGFETQQIPVTAQTSADIVTSGLLIWDFISNGARYRVFVGANKPGAIVCLVYTNFVNRRWIVFAPDDSYTIYMQGMEGDRYQGGVSVLSLSNTYIGTDLVYYSTGYTSGGRISTFQVFTPVFNLAPTSNMQTLLETIYPNIEKSEDVSFTKDNNGFAAACIAKWYTTNGTLITSPILISSDPSFVDMTTTGSNNFAKASFLYEGIRFSMGFWDCVNQTFTSNLIFADLTQFGASSLEKVFNLIKDESFSNILIVSSPDPYHEPGSEEGGADGEDDEKDPVDFTDPPSTTIGSTGFLTIFAPSLGQLRNLASFMWSSFDVDNWRKLFANPMDAILGLHIIPVPPYISGTKPVKVGGISTEIEMDYTTVRYVRRPMGTCDIPKKWGAYLDYNPYTKVSIFLPYIGFKDVDTDDIMGETIALQYMVDILTGACVAELKCGDTVLYSWQGNCANEVPITGSDWHGAIASALGIAGSVAATALTGGASAPMIAGTIASVGANSMNLKPSINRSGAISGSAGFMGSQRPYIIRTIPNLVIPTDQNKFIGYPSFVNASLGSLSGYNEISAIHLEGIPATGNELSEIETLLKGGVIF